MIELSYDEILKEIERITKENKVLRFLNEINEDVLERSVKNLNDEMKELTNENKSLEIYVDYWHEMSDHYHNNYNESGLQIKKLTDENENIKKEITELASIVVFYKHGRDFWKNKYDKLVEGRNNEN